MFATSVLFLCVALSLSGCGDAGSPVATAPKVARVVVTPASVTLASGATQSLTATVQGEDGSTIAGRTVVWRSSDSTVVSVDAQGHAQAKANPGGSTRQADVIATCDGVQGTAAVSVLASPVARIRVTPDTVRVTEGGSGSVTAVAFDSAGQPLSGRTILWASSDTTVATISAAGVVSARAAGTATLTASNAGVSGTALVLVAPAGTPITLTFCAQAPPGDPTYSYHGLPTWFAVQDSSGPWRAVPLQGARVTFGARSSRFSYALVVIESGGAVDVQVTSTTVAEIAPMNGRQCVDEGALATMTATVSGLRTQDQALVSVGPNGYRYATASQPTVDLQVPSAAGTDAVAVRDTNSTRAQTGILADRIILRRDVPVVPGGTLAPFDFGSVEAAILAGRDSVRSRTNSAQGTTTTAATLVTALGTRVTLASQPCTTNGGCDLLLPVPATGLQAGDRVELTVTGSVPLGASMSSLLSASASVQAAGRYTLTLPPALSPAAALDSNGGAYPRFRMCTSRDTALAGALTAVFQQSGSGTVPTLVFTLRRTAGYAAATTQWGVQLPDFSGVPGWRADWTPRSGQSTRVIVDAYGGSYLPIFASPALGDALAHASWQQDGWIPVAQPVNWGSC